MVLSIVSLVLIGGLVIWQSILIKRHFTAIQGFELLLTKFIEVNQNFYEGQKSVAKKDKEMLEGLVKQTAEISIIRRYATQVHGSLNGLADISKSLKEIQKEIKTTSEELNVSKDVANSLATVSNNIRILDRVVNSLRQSIDLLKRRTKDAT